MPKLPQLQVVHHDGKARTVDELAEEIARFALPIASEPADPKAFIVITTGASISFARSTRDFPSFRHNFAPHEVSRIPDFLRKIADAIEKS